MPLRWSQGPAYLRDGEAYLGDDGAYLHHRDGNVSESAHKCSRGSASWMSALFKFHELQVTSHLIDDAEDHSLDALSFVV